MNRRTHRATTDHTDTVRAANGSGKDDIHFWDDFSYYEHPAGGAGIDRRESPLPMATLDAGRQFDANMPGAAGWPRWDAEPIEMVEPYGWGV